MSLCDPYAELELYLKEAESEISKVFDRLELGPQDLDPFLVQFDARLKSDLNELLAKYGLKDDEGLRAFLTELGAGPGRLDAAASPVDVATQTSPSLSPSSTNLTWASECSSSPCLTSTSDDDAQSTSSSTDVRPPRWRPVLGGKSSSAPVLKKVPFKVNKQCRSQSDRHLAEIEAAEACKWLRATGFPQYAQMYEDMQFPVEVGTAAQDHPLLERDVLESLFRRLQTLNNCANLHHQRAAAAAHRADESEDEYCALSDKWTYQTDIRRWSRIGTKLPPRESRRPPPRPDHALPGLTADSESPDDGSARGAAAAEAPAAQSPKERMKRAGSSKFRRRRDGVFIGENGSKLLDTLSQQLNELKIGDIKPVSDSECTPVHCRRPRTKSFDKSDTWSHPQNANERVIWRKLPQREMPPPDRAKAADVEVSGVGPPLYTLSCTQLQVLRKLALLKLTAHMEKHCPSHRTGWNWDLPKFIRKIKTPAYRDKNVFGVPITVTLQRTGLPLPRNIEEALLWLGQNGRDQVGIFRRPGVKSRILQLRNAVEASADILSFNDQQCYDVADMVKQYFRELPETLLTNKLSETFILIFQYVPPYLRRESVICAILLLPDEHVQVLQTLLHFLLQVAGNSDENQMNESNLATCFAPSLFHYSQMSAKSLGAPHPKELAENRAGQDCLLYLLKNTTALFRVPKEFLQQCKSTEFKESAAVALSELGAAMGGWRDYLSECQTALLREAKERNRGWVFVGGHHTGVDVSFKKVADGHPLRLWRVAAEVEAPPGEVLGRVLRERHLWDPELRSARVVAQVDKSTEVFQYVRRSVAPLPHEEYCVVRAWRTDLPKDACLIVETSVEYPDAPAAPNTVRGIVLASRYLIEPCGSGRSRLLHLSRVDVMGKTPDWYHKNYGHINALFIANIANSFYQNAMGPESKV